jgi:predicted transcriptional regulator of viral defense system
MSSSEINRFVNEFAASHGGVVTSDALRQSGFTRNMIDGRVRRHGWVSVGRGAYRLFPARDHLDTLAAALAVLERAVVSHESAAELHGIRRVPWGTSVVTTHTRTTHDFAGVEIHRAHDLDDWHLTRVEGFPVTTVARTVVDLAMTRSVGHVGAIVDDLVSRKQLSLDDLEAVAQAVGRRGKPGTLTVRTVIERRIGVDRSESELERRARRLIAEAGLPMPRPEYPIPWAPHRRFDDAYPKIRLALEWDSVRYHGQLETFELDRQRDRDAVINGWRIVRFTWKDVTERPDRVIATIATLLRRSA